VKAAKAASVQSQFTHAVWVLCLT